jgi:RHS repeat-associated protein
VGNPTAINYSDNSTTENLTFSYDELDQLDAMSDSVSANTQETVYSYQQGTAPHYYNIGNMVEKGSSGRTESYNGRPHQTTASWLGSYSYDGNGNRVADPTYASVTYDVENRLTQLGSPAALTNTYDGDGTRIVRAVTGGATTHFVGDTYEYTLTTSTPTVYYLFGGIPVALKKGSTLYYLHHDHLGSLVAVTDTSGNELWWGRYYPYGELRLTGGSTPTSQLPTDRLFTGQTRDLNTVTSGVNPDAYYFFKSRYYDATIGRFHIPDAVVPGAGNPQTLNRYAYALNNPLRLVDPSGHDPVDWFNANWVREFRAHHNNQDPQPDDYVYRFTSMAEASGMDVPEKVVIPNGVDIGANIDKAKTLDVTPYIYSVDGVGLGMMAEGNLITFAKWVNAGGPWDYKLLDDNGTYEGFGNFNYGVVGAAAGISLGTLRRAAGGAQIKDTLEYKYNAWRTGQPDLMRFEPGWPLGAPGYGDDPHDQTMIILGYMFYQAYSAAPPPSTVPDVSGW